MPDRSDVVIAGGSIAGTALAALLGRQGVGVTVLEKSPKPEHYKVLCTHFIQAGATPVLERLGLTETLDAAGAIRNGLEIWTEGGGGWVVAPDDEQGYSIRREKLDPMLRELAAGTPNVTVRQGVTVTELARDASGRPSGLRGRTTTGEEVAIDADVVVGADGRGSATARLAGIPGRVQPHGRFGYMTYYEDLELSSRGDHSQMWVGPDTYYVFPNDDGLVIAAAFVRKDQLATFKADPEAALLAGFARLPDAPDFTRATRVSPMIGKLDMPNVVRPAGRPGVAFVGDAAQASDPLWGVGCGFALMSAAWLADELAGAFTAGADPDAALERYRRHHRRMLLGHHLQMCDFSSGRDLRLNERMMFRGAARDPRSAALIGDIAARAKPIERTMTPWRVARAIATGAAR
jgi:2-polyprenyl-6-methoxyphenol hydroxylase-like FAD-dependent oxidoreductase